MPANDDNENAESGARLTSGTRVNHYRIIEKIGAGGMGEVYLAEDTELYRKVALKFLPPDLCHDADCRARFKREAQAVAKLSHPNIVTLHEVADYLDRPYIVMEYLGGKSLREIIQAGELPPVRAVDLAIQIAEGLNAAHRTGVVHRDIKPANIVVTDGGRARILDFGLATITGSERLTQTGSTVGTLGYMSPEQTRGEDVDPSSDIFSLGVILYEMITGRLPFRGDHEAAILYAIAYEEPEPLKRYRNHVPDGLQRIVSKALAKGKDLRYQHADELAADLKHLLHDSQSTSFRRPPSPTKSRWKLVAGIAAAVLVVVAAGVYFAWFESTHRAAEGGEPLIAVLPFENLGNSEDEYFADGITEEITSRLAGIKGLGVISRTSAMQYRKSGKSLRQIGKELGVTYILEGSVRWAKTEGSPRVRITPQLIRVSDDRHLWADNYEREMMEVFAVQADIAAQIVDQLGLTLVESDRTALASRPTANSRAYDYYLRGIIGVRRLDWSLPTLSIAAANLDSAVMIDPSFALAYAVRSRAYTLLAFISASPAFRTVARESFEKALQLQPNLSYGHMAAGIYYNLEETDYDKALTELNRAVSELHNDADLIGNIAFVQFRQGKFDEASENYRKAAELDPLNPAVHRSRSELFRFKRMFAEAEQSIDRAIALDPQRADFYLEKLIGNVSRYGDWSRGRKVVHEALGTVDTLEFISNLIISPSTGGYMSGLSLDSLFAETGIDLRAMQRRFRSECRQETDIELYYCREASWLRSIGNKTLAAIYLDSARILVEKQLQGMPNDWMLLIVLGNILADQGLCTRAVDMGIRAKELLSIGKCHW